VFRLINDASSCKTVLKVGLIKRLLIIFQNKVQTKIRLSAFKIMAISIIYSLISQLTQKAFRVEDGSVAKKLFTLINFARSKVKDS